MEKALRAAEIGRLGSCVEGEPYVVPLSFAYHDGRIVFHCAGKRKKLDDILGLILPWTDLPGVRGWLLSACL